MRVLIVEDERPIASYIEALTRECLGSRLSTVHQCHELERAAEHLATRAVDVCLLDLNLNGEDGYRLLTEAAAGSFHTIVISANTDRAVEAFRYGVVDFVSKPFDVERLRQAFARIDAASPGAPPITKYVCIRRGGGIRVLPLEAIAHFRAAGHYVEAHLAAGGFELLDKSMAQLERMLPGHFARVHRSCFVDVRRIDWFGHVSGGRYEVRLRDGTVLPLSRKAAHDLRDRVEAGDD
ncbi:MAG TPA: LytTR family DNA-binding domain-containing protein, partial [bacterium]|nr:LytTR family DNA-binding domain-containing protein [bacterium]